MSKEDSKKRKSEFVTEEIYGSLALDDRGSTVQVSRVKVNGETKIDIRKHVASDKYNGPTGQGILMSITAFNALGSLIAAIPDQIKKNATTKSTRRNNKPVNRNSCAKSRGNRVSSGAK